MSGLHKEAEKVVLTPNAESLLETAGSLPVRGSTGAVLTPNKESLLETREKELRQKLDDEVPLTSRSAVISSSRKRMEKFLAEHDTSDEDEDGETRPRLGAGLIGSGATLFTWHLGRRRPFHDGAGLCSPGRWQHGCRRSDTLGLSARIRMGLAKTWSRSAR